ncbi:MAG: hypothetical protein ACK47B_17895 [Armatimonadota bacterium]
MAAFCEGDRVCFSPLGEAKVRSMPEAWGLHTALSRAEVGEVVDYFPPEDDLPAQLSVEFPSGGAYHWDADCFVPAPPAPDRDPH